MALVPPSAEALLDLQKHLRELASALRDKGYPIPDDAPLVDFTRAVTSAPTPDVIELFSYSHFCDFKNRRLPPVRLSTTYNPRPTLQGVFQRCTFLTELPEIQGAQLAVSTQSMCQDCWELTSATLPAMPACTTAQSMFQACSKLTSVTLPAMPACTTAQSMFQACSKLTSVTLPAMPACTNLRSTLQACAELRTASLGELPQLKDAYCLCYQCPELVEVTLTTGASVTNYAYAFSGCAKLERIEGVLDFSSATAINNVLENCWELREVRIRGLRDSFQMHQSPKLSTESLRYLIERAQQVTGKTILLSRTLFTERRADIEELSALASAKGFTIIYR